MINMLFSLYNFHESWAKDSVSKYVNSNDKVLIIPFSFYDVISSNEDWQALHNKTNGKDYESIVTPFLSFGIKEENIDWINYFKDTKEEAKAKIKNSNIIFFTGGLPDKMFVRLMEFDLINDLENFNGVIIGSSAGAVIQLLEYHLTPDGDYSTFSYYPGLNMIKNFAIEVHYEGTYIQKESIKKVLNEKKDTLYAITDNGGLIVDNKEVTLLGETHTFTIDNLILLV